MQQPAKLLQKIERFEIVTAEIAAQVSKEIETGEYEPVLWAAACADSNGDADRSKALYIRSRYSDLLEKSRSKAQSGDSASASSKTTHTSARPIDVLRQSLRAQLFKTGKDSFYRSLGVEADCSDADLAMALLQIKAKESNGEVLPPEIRYAMDELDNPERREAYDRRLLSILNTPSDFVATRSVAMQRGSSESVFMEWWGTKKISILIGIGALFLVGSTTLSFYKASSKKEIEKGLVANQQKAVQVLGENDAYRAHTERQAVVGVLDNQAAVIDHSARLQDRRESRYDRELEYKANYGSAQIQMQQQQLEQQQMQMEWKRRQYEQERAQQESDARARETERSNTRIASQLANDNCRSARSRNNSGEIARWC